MELGTGIRGMAAMIERRIGTFINASGAATVAGRAYRVDVTDALALIAAAFPFVAGSTGLTVASGADTTVRIRTAGVSTARPDIWIVALEAAANGATFKGLRSGVARLSMAAGALTAGAFLASDAAGDFIAVTANDSPLGMLLEDSAGSVLAMAIFEDNFGGIT
jgi:hypothetical protein